MSEETIQREWQKHQQVIAQVVKAEQWRACIGWACKPIEGECCQHVGGHLFLANEDLAGSLLPIYQHNSGGMQNKPSNGARSGNVLSVTECP